MESMGKDRGAEMGTVCSLQVCISVVISRRTKSIPLKKTSPHKKDFQNESRHIST